MSVFDMLLYICVMDAAKFYKIMQRRLLIEEIFQYICVVKKNNHKFIIQ